MLEGNVDEQAMEERYMELMVVQMGYGMNG